MYKTVSCAVHAPEGFSFVPDRPVMPVHVHPGLHAHHASLVNTLGTEERKERGTHTNKCAVTFWFGKLRSSCARPSVRLFTAALEALYAALPLYPVSHVPHPISSTQSFVSGE